MNLDLSWQYALQQLGWVIGGISLACLVVLYVVLPKDEPLQGYPEEEFDKDAWKDGKKDNQTTGTDGFKDNLL